MRRFTCLLALISGLIFSPAFAASYADNSAALSACLAEAEYWIGYKGPSNQYTHQARCYLNPVSSPDKYICKVIRNNQSQAYCSEGHSASFTLTGSAAATWYSQNTAFASAGCNLAGAYCFTSNACSSKPPSFEVDFYEDTIYNGSLENVCAGGCRYSGTPGYRGTYPNGNLFYTYTKVNNDPCSPDEDIFNDENPDETTPEDIKQDADGDGVKDGEDVCPNDPTNTCNLPDDSKDSDGDGIPDYKDPYPNDATNGKGDGNGSGDGNSSSGGGDCVTPPSCAGDPIQCNILFQSWAHRCGKTGGTAAEGPSGPGGGDGSSTDLKPITDRWDSTFGDGSYQGDTTTPVSGLSGYVNDLTIDQNKLDTSGLGLSRSCPAILNQPINFSFIGRPISVEFTYFCDALELVGQLLVVFSCFLAIRLLLSGSNS